MNIKKTPLVKLPKNTFYQEKGAVLPESVISVSFFLTFLCFFFDTFKIISTKVFLYYVVITAQRWAALNQQLNDSNGHPIPRVTSIQQIIIDSGKKFGLNLLNENITICPVNLSCTPSTSDSGKSDDFITIKVKMPVKLLFMSVSTYITTTTFAKNEPE